MRACCRSPSSHPSKSLPSPFQLVSFSRLAVVSQEKLHSQTLGTFMTLHEA